MIAKFLQILGIQHLISKKNSRSREQFFFTVGQNNFGIKIPLLKVGNIQKVNIFKQSNQITNTEVSILKSVEL